MSLQSVRSAVLEHLRRDDAVPPTLHHRRLLTEIMIRASVSFLVLVVNELLGVRTGAGGSPLIRVAALLGLLLNGPYYVAARRGRWSRLQAYLRMLIDVPLVTVGAYGSGGFAAAQYIGLYAVLSAYVGVAFSPRTCLIAVGVATASYLAITLLRGAGWLLMTEVLMPDTGAVAAFNLLILNLVGGLTAVLAEAYRRSRRQLLTATQDLERAHDELLRLNSEIQRASRLCALGEVVAGVNHEIRNVVQAALVHLDLARERVRDEEAPQALPHLNAIGDCCDAVMRIVKNGLELARQSSVDRAPLSMLAVVRNVVQLKGYDLRRDRIALRVDVPEGLPPIMAAPFELQQVLLNLISNAQDALHGAAPPRAITMVGVTGPERVVLEVWDTGPGVPPDVVPRLFEPFYTTKAHGTGLGLAISAAIVKELGGELTAENGPNGGAVFRMSLPVATRIKPSSMQNDADGPAERAGQDDGRRRPDRLSASVSGR